MIRIALAGIAGALAQAPASAPASRARAAFTAADFDRHVREIRESGKLPKGFAVVVEPPFVVIGDEDAAAVRGHAERTVRWAVRKLKDAYFARDPDEILDIWLFRDAESYQRNVRSIFGEAPGTPFGYYSSEHRALIMNIGTGGGTLVHEIVHPFVRANFPDCPAWFNEGLGSLYEQSAERDGRIQGLTNWRLAGLQEAIREKRTMTLEALVRTTDPQFYGEDRGVCYAQARYLLYFLQEKKLLGRFYREFLAKRAADPTGLATLRALLGVDDLAKTQKEWEAFVLALRFP